jgi:hypothetical protein
MPKGLIASAARGSKPVKAIKSSMEQRSAGMMKVTSLSEPIKAILRQSVPGKLCETCPHHFDRMIYLFKLHVLSHILA